MHFTSAALLGVGLDDLVKRDERRRAVRRRVTTLVLASLVIVFAGLSWVANDQRIAAVEARAQADSARVGEYSQELRDLGVELKDALEGLVDFPAEIDGEPVGTGFGSVPGVEKSAT